MTTIYDKVRPGLTRGQWRRLRRQLRTKRINWYTLIPSYVDFSLRELLDYAATCQRRR